jgi:membrane-bound inhibitor of C-type lysozyme
MMKRLLALTLAMLGAQTVLAMPLTVPQIQTASTQTTRYDCKDGKSVSVQYTNTRNHQSFAALTVDGRKLLFVNVISGSGARYVADQYTWWTKGPQANLYDEMAAKDSPPLLADCEARKK